MISRNDPGSSGEASSYERSRDGVRARIGRAGAALLAAAIGAVPAGASGIPRATPEPPAQIRLRGEVVETGCFVIGGRRGEQHRQCAIACARAGQPLGVLDEKTDTLYLVVVDRRSGPVENPLLPYIAQRVEVRGEPLEYGDLPALIVSGVRSLER